MSRERSERKELLMGVLMNICSSENALGKQAAMFPPGMAVMLGIIPPPKQRLNEYMDLKAARELLKVSREHESEHEHSEDCNGECGVEWFFSTLADFVMDMMQSDGERVAALLSEMNVPNAREDSHAE